MIFAFKKKCTNVFLFQTSITAKKLCLRIVFEWIHDRLKLNVRYFFIHHGIVLYSFMVYHKIRNILLVCRRLQRFRNIGLYLNSYLSIIFCFFRFIYLFYSSLLLYNYFVIFYSSAIIAFATLVFVIFTARLLIHYNYFRYFGRLP